MDEEISDIEGKKVDLDNLDEVLADDTEEETSEDSQSEEKTEEEKPAEEGENAPTDKELPFHKHPRFKQMIDDNKALKSEVEELKNKPQETDNKEALLPAWWVTLAGNDAVSKDAYKGFTEQTKTDRASIKQEMQDDQKIAEEKQSEHLKKQDEWVNNEVQTLRDDGLKFDRKELIKVAIDFKPTDEQGNISLKKAYDIMEIQKSQVTGKKKEKLNERKKIAGDTTSTTKEEGDKSQVVGTNTLRGKSFTTLAGE